MLLVHFHRVIAHYVAGKVVLPVNILFHSYRSSRHIGQVAQLGFDLAKLYAIAPQLHLVIKAAMEVDSTIGIDDSGIASFIYHIAGQIN